MFRQNDLNEHCILVIFTCFSCLFWFYSYTASYILYYLTCSTYTLSFPLAEPAATVKEIMCVCMKWKFVQGCCVMCCFSIRAGWPTFLNRCCISPAFLMFTSPCCVKFVLKTHYIILYICHLYLYTYKKANYSGPKNIWIVKSHTGSCYLVCMSFIE